MPIDNSLLSLYTPITVTHGYQKPEENYAEVLDRYDAIYHKVDYYWQVGESNKVQGWILHLSVIAPQITDLLHNLLPILLKTNMCFKLPKDRKTARNILDGNLGYEQLGKVISIYPENDQDAIDLARQLVRITQTYRGPSIPTAAHLGGIVYTRYGAINPIVRQGANGENENYIYDSIGELIKDTYPIPFHLPAGIAWPFGEGATLVAPKAAKNVKHIYKPMNILKPDPRGNVTKALYLKSLFRVGTCVMKAGKKNMLADDMGRDIQDRLIWQRDLHNELGEDIRLPKILDFFEENEEIYLVMEFIKGKSLHDSLVEIHGNQKSWFQLSLEEKTKILDWLIKIVGVIDLLHKKGFVHRDIQPGNFMIDSQGNIVLIDTELAYDLRKEPHEPPFELGTPGFMSPEQDAISIPTVKEDIYGLGALMINCFTCINAPRFDTKDFVRLARNLDYFIHHQEIAELIAACLNHQSSERPMISQIKARLNLYKEELLSSRGHVQDKPNLAIDDIEYLNTLIAQALAGLSKEPMPVSNGIWLSKTIKTDTGTGTVQKEFSAYGGIHTGMTGVLYLLARAKKAGHELETNKTAFKESWKYVYSEYLKNLERVSPGLYTGAAGIALALAEGIGADLLEDSTLTRGLIRKCLEKSTGESNIADGVAGQGIVLLQSSPYIGEDVTKALLHNCIRHLLNTQQKDGSWNIKSPETGKEYTLPVSWSQGITGIIYFLLAYHSTYQDEQVNKSLHKSLDYLSGRTKNLKGLFIPSVYRKLLNNKPEIGDERTSAILCFLYAYDFLKDSYYKTAAESALCQYPEFVVNNNFSQDGGMAALGEVYLEAWRVFNNPEWKKRADQIATIFLHTTCQGDMDTYHWFTDETRKPIADLLTGNSGIIHFLLRCRNPDKMGHILLK